MQWYEALVESGRAATLWLLLGFIVTFGITRWITLRIRARSLATDEEPEGPIKDVIIGGVHIHHQVWGILLVLITGLLTFRFDPASPWQELLALLFGVGAALALDEFALWLHLDDVYWSEEGRKSVDAVLLAVVIGVAMLVATSPLGIDTAALGTSNAVIIGLVVLLHVGWCIACLLKGKNVMGLMALAIPTLGVIGALRLAKPQSFWARRHYSPEKLARAEARFPPGRTPRIDRLRDVLTGRA